MKVDIKPLSVNECFQGRRFKTPKYKSYEKHLLLLLKPLEVPKGQLKLNITFGLSSKLSDIDNPLKAFIDILQKKYLFNDRDIFELNIKKDLVPKGYEYIDFKITPYK